jgi:hypothetical protein
MLFPMESNNSNLDAPAVSPETDEMYMDWISLTAMYPTVK